MQTKSSFRYRLDATNCDACEFDLNEYTGHLCVKNVLDREHLNRIWLNISVYDTYKLYTASSSVYTFWLEILDLNDNAPTFSQNHYLINVLNDYDNESSEEEENFILIFNENARDKDLGANGTLTYEIIIDNRVNNEMFYVEANNGKIWMSKKQQPTQNQVYYFKLMCRDNGAPSFKFTMVDINVKVLNICVLILFYIWID
jgi:hypothetical protein